MENRSKGLRMIRTTSWGTKVSIEDDGTLYATIRPGEDDSSTYTLGKVINGAFKVRENPNFYLSPELLGIVANMVKDYLTHKTEPETIKPSTQPVEDEKDAIQITDGEGLRAEIKYGKFVNGTQINCKPPDDFLAIDAIQINNRRIIELVGECKEHRERGEEKGYHNSYKWGNAPESAHVAADEWAKTQQAYRRLISDMFLGEVLGE